MKTVVVIPAYNEGWGIGKVIKEVKDLGLDVIVVDDGSIDETKEIARQSGAIVLNHCINRGQGAALQTGINFSLNFGADIIVTFDADGQHNSKEIKEIIDPILSGEFDVVLGSRFIKSKISNLKTNIPMLRKFILRLAAWFTRLYTGVKVTDAHNGFRAFSKNSAALIEIKQDGMAHASEIIEQIKKHQLKFKEVAVTINYTDYSLKKGQKLTNSFKIILDLIIGRISK